MSGGDGRGYCRAVADDVAGRVGGPCQGDIEAVHRCRGLRRVGQGIGVACDVGLDRCRGGAAGVQRLDRVGMAAGDFAFEGIGCQRGGGDGLAVTQDAVRGGVFVDGVVQAGGDEEVAAAGSAPRPSVGREQVALAACVGGAVVDGCRRGVVARLEAQGKAVGGVLGYPERRGQLHRVLARRCRRGQLGDDGVAFVDNYHGLDDILGKAVADGSDGLSRPRLQVGRRPQRRGPQGDGVALVVADAVVGTACLAVVPLQRHRRGRTFP